MVCLSTVANVCYLCYHSVLHHHKSISDSQTEDHVCIVLSLTCVI